MPRKKVKQVTCKKCGYTFKPTDIEPEKTWHMAAPFPDKNGNITITVMAVWTCPNCGAKIKGVYGKIKTGEELKGTNRTELLIKTLESSEKISISEIATKIKVSEETARKAVEYLISKGKVRGKIVDNYFLKE